MACVAPSHLCLLLSLLSSESKGGLTPLWNKVLSADFCSFVMGTS